MLSDGLTLLGTSKATNLTIESGGSLPGTGIAGALYYKASVGLHVHDGSAWNLVGSGSVGSTAWGGITGTLSSQTDLASALGGKLAGNQNITVSGDATGSGATAITLTLASVGTPGTYRSVTTDAKGRVTAGTNPTTLSGYGITDANPAYTGDVTKALNGTALTLATTGVTAGTYSSVTADAKGRVTAGTNPTTLAGYGITDALSTSGGNVAGDLIPATNVTYSLGSATKMWKDIFVGPGSLYVNGKEIVSDVSGTIVLGTSIDQNLRIETTGAGDLQIHAAGTGTIQIKSTMTVTTGQKILDSAGIQVEFGDNVELGGNKITGIGTCTANADAANKLYVDTATSADATIVRTSGTQSIGGQKTFTGNVILQGNLTISGTTTTVNSQTVLLADNILELNSDFTSGTPSEDSGFQVRRGDLGIVKFVWDETNDRFTMRDGAGAYLPLYTTAGITAGTFTGALAGNAGTATALATARTINGASFDGTGNVSFTTDAVAEGSTNEYYTNARASAAAPVQSVFGRTGAVSLLSGDVTTALTFTPAAAATTLAGYGITNGQPLDADLTAIAALAGTSGLLKKTAADTWALDTSAYLTANQTITLTGDVTGTGTGSFGATLASVGTAGTYRSVTTDGKGRVTAGTNPTTLAGYGITDAYASSNPSGYTANAGTVTSASVVAANGVSGSVATATTTPAITLTLGAITPSSVAATGAVSGSNLSGTNTGDQTSVSGNAGTATALQTARTINGTPFDGTANITTWSAPAIGSVTASGASVTVDVTGRDVFRLTMGASVTALTLTGAVDGQKIVLEVVQDATGSRTMTWPSNVRFGTDITAAVLTTAASKTDRVGLMYNGAASKYDVIAFCKGF